MSTNAKTRYNISKVFGPAVPDKGSKDSDPSADNMAGIDINLMPLEDSIFHCSKSENKWMEAALVKVPSVMSRNREMEGVIENGVDGWLCSDKEEWKKALTTLIEEKTARVQMGEKAHKKVMCQYVTQNTGKDAREELLCSEKYS